MIDYESEARAKLEEGIQRTLGGTQNAVERVLNEVPQDSIVRGKALDFHFRPRPGGGEDNDSRILEMVAGDGKDGKVWTLHRNAERQLAERAGVPQQYFDKLRAGEAGEWQQQLVTEILGRSYRNLDSKYLVRSVAGEARGILSDRFRRLDSRPIMETFLNACRAVGAQPYGGVATDVRVALKAILPTVFTFPSLKGTSGYPIEAIAVGLEWSNSDYGHGYNILRLVILRLWCFNGATMDTMLKQVHLGARLAEEIEYSEKTYRLDTEATVSAVKDATKALLGPEKVQNVVDRCKLLASKEADWAATKADLSKKLTKDELRKVDDAFNGQDCVNLPAGKTTWRLSNSLSWLANAAENADRKLELERLAGGLLAGKEVKEAA